MEINWSTFVFEIVNFLALVWILKHFLYQPVLDIIKRRRVAIENQLAEAKQQQTDASVLKQQYEHRLADWEQQRQHAMRKLKTEIEEIRHQQLENLQAELAAEEEKTRFSRERQDIQLKREIEQRALHRSGEFASRLLAEAAGPELENRFVDLLVKELETMPDDRIKTFTNKWEISPEHILVTSVWPLTDSRRQQLEAALKQLTGQETAVQYKQDETLLAGLNISIGAFLLQLNVRDELRGFVELGDAES